MYLLKVNNGNIITICDMMEMYIETSVPQQAGSFIIKR